MASYTDIINDTMRYQIMNLDRRSSQKSGIQRQSVSFDQVMAQSLEKNQVRSASNAYAPDAPSPISQAEVENELKFRECLRFVLAQEGSKTVVEDGGKESSKYGILQSTARSMGYKGDIKNISKPEAEAIYKKLWVKSGANALSYPMSLIHFDTYVNSPATAKKLLKSSDGNLEVYLKSREKRYDRLAEVRPETYRKYLKGWKNRINSLKNAVAQYRKLNTLASADLYGAAASDRPT